MRIFFIGIVLIIFSCSSLRAQNYFGKVTYKKEFSNHLLDTTSKNSLYKRNRRVYNKIWETENEAKKILDELRFELRFRPNESLFSVQSNLKLEKDFYYGFAIGPYGSRIYYSNLEKNEFLTSVEAYGELFLIKGNQPNWKITSEVKNINGYNCYKAITSQVVKSKGENVKAEIIAWFSLDIPVPYGPLGYAGLPGLILELEVGKVKFIMSKIELNPKKQINFNRPNKGLSVTKKQFEEIGTKTMVDFKKSIEN